MNYKANIAFGGQSACDTVIVNNELTQSRAEGIFCIESGFAWIFKNTIFDNSDGIVMFDSCPHVVGNDINQNQRSGISCCGASFPKMEKNQIYGNIQSGVNIRDTSVVVLRNNKIFSNFYQISARNTDKGTFDSLVTENEVEGDNECSSNCLIF